MYTVSGSKVDPKINWYNLSNLKFILGPIFFRTQYTCIWCACTLIIHFTNFRSFVIICNEIWKTGQCFIPRHKCKKATRWQQPFLSSTVACASSQLTYTRTEPFQSTFLHFDVVFPFIYWSLRVFFLLRYVLVCCCIPPTRSTLWTKQNTPKYFCHIFYKTWPILIKFGTYCPE